mgnify:CR=1 FL=1|jgi:hypothetical protein
MARNQDRFAITLQLGGKRMVAKAPLKSIKRLVFIFNRQFTNAPNTTQIASGAGHSGAAGNNAAIRSPRTKQQQSVGANGTARNTGGGGKASSPRSRAMAAGRHRHRFRGKEVVVVINEQIVKMPPGSRNASATQVASGAGKFGTGGTNSAISSPGTRQQHAVGGGGTAINKLLRSRKKRRKR